MSEKEKKKILLSVAIVTYNEEKNIKDCIESVHDFADEVIILDSYSNDRTLEIASEYSKVQIYQHPFSGHIEQKNRAIELCHGEWILSIDADERVGLCLKQEIINLLSQDLSKYNGFKIARLTFHMGRFIYHGGWYPLYRYRLFRKGYGRWTGENPHDYLEIQGKGKNIKGDILHYSFLDLTHQVDTINKFSSIVGFTRFQKGVKFPILKSIYKPFVKFLECYIFKLGFLDGYAGFVIAISSAYSTFLKFAKLYELDRGFIERPSNLRKDYGR